MAWTLIIWRAIQNLWADILTYRSGEPFKLVHSVLGDLRRGVSEMTDATLVSLITAAIMVLFILGVPILLIIGLWSSGSA